MHVTYVTRGHSTLYRVVEFNHRLPPPPPKYTHTHTDTGDSMKTKQPRDNAGNLNYCQMKMVGWVTTQAVCLLRWSILSPY